MAGTLKMSEIAKVTFKLNDLNLTATITHGMHVYSDEMEYDMIIGQDLLHELGIILDFKNKIVIWNDAIIDMISKNLVQENSYHVDESDSLMGKTKWILAIHKAKYRKADINQVTADCIHLNDNQRLDLRKLLKRYETIFDGTLGTWKDFHMTAN